MGGSLQDPAHARKDGVPSVLTTAPIADRILAPQSGEGTDKITVSEHLIRHTGFIRRDAECKTAVAVREQLLQTGAS